MTLQLSWKINHQSESYPIKLESLWHQSVIIGRSDQCDVIINERTVSRQHAKLFLKDKQIHIRNINTSDNILQVNDHLLGPKQAVRLQAGDRLQIGQVTMTVQPLADKSATQPSMPAVAIQESLPPQSTVSLQALSRIPPDDGQPDRLARQNEPATPLTKPNSGLIMGQKLGQYELVELVGRGGMAEVYKARQENMDRYVAVKVLHPHLAAQRGFVCRFTREAHSLGKLHHPHILPVFDFNAWLETYYMVMDYLPGHTLQSYLAEKGCLPLSEALSIVRQVTDALVYAHQQEIIHRDIKAENIMFTDETCSRVVLADFGLARLLGKNMTANGTKIGTPGYMSPEAAQGERADVRSDIYSLGVVLFYMLTGQLPYNGETPLALFEQQLNQPIPSPRNYKPDLPVAVETLLMKALAKDAKERFQTAAELRAALDQLEQPTRAEPPPPPKVSRLPREAMRRANNNRPAKKRSKRPLNRWWVFAATLAGVMSVAGATAGVLIMGL